MSYSNFMSVLILTIFTIVVLTIADEHHHEEHHDYYSHPKYKFDYGVHDSHTGDNKNQWEIRDGDVVKGGYEFHDADGTKRVVEYSSDKHTGFNAVVKRVGHAQHPHIYGHKHGHEDEGKHEEHEYHGGHATSYANVNLHNEPHHVIHHH